jgi:enoyl-CoA hydratase/carnithine racemase
MVSYEAIILEKADFTATITFNRPEVFNAYSEQMSGELKAALAEVASDEAVRVLFLKGAGGNFLAGADINMLNAWSEVAKGQGSPEVKRILDNHFSPTSLEELPIPVIALVDGMAWGTGSEIAIAADIRICTIRASFAQPEINLGIITGGGASQRLPRIVGTAKAMEMILTGKPISAQDADKWGLVSQVVEPEQLEEAGMKMAKSIAAKSPLMVKWAKECVHLVRDHDLQSGIQKELTRFSEAFATEDSSEGTRAFLEKRKARFTGK